MQSRMSTTQETRKGTAQDRAPWLPLSAQRSTAQPGLCSERNWRQPINADPEQSPAILASRWRDERTMARAVHNTGRADQYIIAVALRPVQLRIGRGKDTVFEGVMPSGMVHITEPGQVVEAEFFTPCDFIHFHVDAATLRSRWDIAGAGSPRLRDLMVRDDLAAQLSRTLTGDPDGGDPLYAASVGQTILMRVLAQRSPAARVGALPKWRMRRVQEHLAVNISEPISLSDLAEAAGLSRMHFAAQFRVATGCRPHDYLLQHRIECAKTMLADTEVPLVEVALNVGFQTQSHFSTVFKRLAGDTPARWKRAQRAA